MRRAFYGRKAAMATEYWPLPRTRERSPCARRCRKLRREIFPRSSLTKNDQLFRIIIGHSRAGRRIRCRVETEVEPVGGVSADEPFHLARGALSGFVQIVFAG